MAKCLRLLYFFLFFLSCLQAQESSGADVLREVLHFEDGRGGRIGYLYVGDHEQGIDNSTWLYLKQALEYYKQHPPLFIILELNTPGGEVFAAQKMGDALKEIDTQYHIPVIAFIHDWAISAGAMLAYSCKFIAPVKGASMGAAEPVLIGETGKMEPASEKINSALRADFANRAEFFGRNPWIAKAMVDKDLILVWRHGKVEKLDDESQLKLEGVEPDEVITRKGKLLTLTAEEMLRYGVADWLFLSKLPPTPGVADDLATRSLEALKIFRENAFFSALPNLSMDTYQMDWKTRFFVFLATPFVASLLLMGLMVGGYMELSQPGLTLPGLIAGSCLFLIILSNYALQIGDWLELIFLVAGLAILFIEFFVLPTFGLFGLVGLFLVVVGLLGLLIPGVNQFSFSHDPAHFYAAGDYFVERLSWIGGAFLCSLLVIICLSRVLLPRSSTFNRLVLKGSEQEASLGFTAGVSPSALPRIGTLAEVLTPLRPVGKVGVDQLSYEALSREGWMGIGEKVEVVGLEENVLIVRRQERR